MDKKITIDISYERVSKILVDICNERIARLKIAIPLCNHSKRKHKAIKMLTLLECIRDRQIQFINEMSTRVEGD